VQYVKSLEDINVINLHLRKKTLKNVVKDDYDFQKPFANSENSLKEKNKKKTSLESKIKNFSMNFGPQHPAAHEYYAWFLN